MAQHSADRGQGTGKHADVIGYLRLDPPPLLAEAAPRFPCNGSAGRASGPVAAVRDGAREQRTRLGHQPAQAWQAQAAPGEQRGHGATHDFIGITTH